MHLVLGPGYTESHDMEAPVMYHRVLVGTDGSETATKAVVAAGALAATHGAQLVVMTAFSPKLSRRALDDFAKCPDEHRWKMSPGTMAETTARDAARAAADAAGPGLEIVVRFEPGPAVNTIVRVAEECGVDLIVVGNRGIGGFGRIVGSIPRAVSGRAPCDVLIIDTTRRRRSAPGRNRRDAPQAPSDGDPTTDAVTDPRPGRTRTRASMLPKPGMRFTPSSRSPSRIGT